MDAHHEQTGGIPSSISQPHPGSYPPSPVVVKGMAALCARER